MTSGLSDFGAGAWLAALFGVTAPIAGYYLALASDDPGPDGDGDTLADLEPPPGTGYARQFYSAGDAWWSANDSYLTNTVEIDFPLPFDDWGRITHYVLCDARSGGDIYAWGAFTNPQNVTAGYSISLPVGGVVLSLASLENSIAL